jgi:hypothetical protein
MGAISTMPGQTACRICSIWLEYLEAPSLSMRLRTASASFLVWAAYFGFAASQFGDRRRAIDAFKGLISASLTQLATEAVALFTAALWFR